MIKTIALWLGLVCFIAGCKRQEGTVLGKRPAGEVRTVIAVKAGDTPQNVSVEGVMVEKCPVAGCWFRVNDGTGTIKVDTKSAGFVVVQVPLEIKVTVSGKVQQEGEETVIEASGLRY
jgi:uncharacterized protein YdeI (BOF family)